MQLPKISLFVRRLPVARVVCACITLLTLSFSVFSADQSEIPADESGILVNGMPVTVSEDISALAGTWGKCLKSVDTRCYFMKVGADGLASILTYISTREKQFGDDPAEKPHCYSVKDRKLARLGNHTYVWQDQLASGVTLDEARLMKIVIIDNAMLVYAGDKLQLSLPAVSQQESEKLEVC